MAVFSRRFTSTTVIGEGGVNTQDDNDDLYGYNAEYDMGGDACIHNLARYVAVAPRDVSTNLRCLSFET